MEEVVTSLIPFLDAHPRYAEAGILERMTEPDRVIMFRVCWLDDENRIRTNRAYRVQFNNSIGPYKGGLRFHCDVTLSVLKFLGFEQTFKNSLTGLPMGGAFLFSDMRDGVETKHWGTYLELDRPHRIVFTWILDEAEESNPGRVSLVVQPDGTGCVATIAHEMDAKWAGHEEQTKNGWSCMVQATEAFLQT